MSVCMGVYILEVRRLQNLEEVPVLWKSSLRFLLLSRLSQPWHMFLNAYTARKTWRRWHVFLHQGWSYQSTHSRHRVLQSEAVTHSLSHNTHRGSYTSHCWAFLIWEHDLTAQELNSLSHVKTDRSSTSRIPFLSRAPSWWHRAHSCVTPPPSDFRRFLPPQGREPPYLFRSLHILSSPPQTSSRLLCRLSGSGFTVQYVVLANWLLSPWIALLGSSRLQQCKSIPPLIANRIL